MLSECDWGWCRRVCSTQEERLRHWKRHVAEAKPIQRISLQRSSQGESYLPPNLSTPAVADAEDVSSNETTEESAPGSQSQSSGPYIPPLLKTHKALERTASDELPAPALSAPPATIPHAPEGSQATQFGDAFTQEMSIQASQDAPSPLPSSQVSFLEPPPSSASKRKRDHDDYGEQDSEDDEGEIEANSSFDIERALLGSTATPLSQSRHYTTKQSRIGSQYSVFGDPEAGAQSEAVGAIVPSIEELDTNEENLNDLPGAASTQPFGFHFSQMPGIGTGMADEDITAEDNERSADADLAPQEESQLPTDNQAEPSAFRLHFSQLYPDLNSLKG